jgi:hypothetical protein
VTREHGYAAYRIDGCRCYACAFAVSEYNARRDRAIAYGTWNPWVSVEPVREHIQLLRSCGMGLRAIAEDAGTSRQQLQILVSGKAGRSPQSKMRPAAAAAILAVEPAPRRMDATGTRRRLQALVAVGWTLTKIGEQAGWSHGNVSVLLRAERVFVATERTVRDLYDALWNQVPPGDSPQGRYASDQSRQLAEREGWPPPMAWDDDDIDDPAAKPRGQRTEVAA